MSEKPISEPCGPGNSNGPINAPDNLLWRAVRHGLRRRCPACGEGRLFTGYLTPVAECGHCSESFAHISADDGPAWATILLTGHIVVAMALYVEAEAAWPLWASMVFFTGLTLAMTLALLPRAKGGFIAAIWATNAREATTTPAATHEHGL